MSFCKRSVWFAVVSMMLTPWVAGAQPMGGKQLRKARKTTEPRVVASLELRSRLRDIPEEAGINMEQLISRAVNAGLTLIPQGMVQVNFPDDLNDETVVDWEIQIPVADPAPENGEREMDGFKLKSIAPHPVVYTFHQGGFNSIDATIQQLMMWAAVEGHTLGHTLSVITRSDPEHTPENALILEVQITVTEQ